MQAAAGREAASYGSIYLLDLYLALHRLWCTFTVARARCLAIFTVFYFPVLLVLLTSEQRAAYLELL